MVAFLLLSVLFLLATPPTRAQLLPSTVGGSSTSTQVSLDETLSVVREAFRVRADELRAGLRDDDVDPSRIGEFSQRALRLGDVLASDVRSALHDLRGDGFLESGEVTQRLGPIWDSKVSDLDQAAQALRQGVAMPPLEDTYDSRLDFLADIAAYTFRTRNSPLDWLLLLGSVLATLLLAWGADRLLHRGAERLSERGLAWSADVLRSVAAPLYATSILLGLFGGLRAVWLPGIAVIMVPRTLVFVLTLAIFWLAWRLCGPAATLLGWLVNRSYSAMVDRHVLVVIARVLRLVVLVVFVVVLAQKVLQSNLAGFVASLGVLGLALALALRGTIRNIFASLTLFADHPFRIGDMVIFDGEWGRIEDVGVRSTRFRSLDGHLVSIPNRELLDRAIDNVSERPHIRRRFRLSLVYDTPPDKVREAIAILEELLDDYEGRPDGLQANVVFESYGEWDLRILVEYYFEPPDYWKALHFDSEVNLAILERFGAAGIEFAFPTETSILRDGNGRGDDATYAAEDDADLEPSASASAGSPAAAGSADAGEGGEAGERGEGDDSIESEPKRRQATEYGSGGSRGDGGSDGGDAEGGAAGNGG